MPTTRRYFLRGLATTLALPALPSLGKDVVQTGVKNRLGFIYIPNGVNVDHWFSADQENLNNSLAPLESLKEDFSIIRNLECRKAYANGDGAGDHARANASFLTGCQAKKTAGADVHLGASVDQIAASKIGSQTRFPSLELSTSLSRRTGRCDSGYSCAYQYNLSWINETTPAPAENNPRLAFEKLFGSGNVKEDQKRLHQRKSVLDFIKAEASSFQKKMGTEDRGKMEEYLTSVREVEKRIESAESYPITRPEGIEPPEGIPKSYRDYIRLQFQIMKLAWQSDLTRVSTFVMGHEGSNRPFPEIGVHGKHHELSHHRGNKESLKDLAKIDLFYAEELARFLSILKETPDGEESNLLENSMLLYGGGIQDGNRHNHSDLPLILAGHGGGRLKQGEMFWAGENTPVTNLYLSLLDKMNISVDRIGDSTEMLKI